MNNYSNRQLYSLVLLRFLIGWHFLYEGLVKLVNPNWSAKAYLANSEGPFAFIFRGMAGDSTITAMIDFMNQWGLIIIGLALILGIVEKIVCYGGIILLATYYLAYPPFPGLDISVPTEGSYILVNKNLIEMAALWVLILYPTSHIVGFQRYFHRKQSSTV